MALTGSPGRKTLRGPELERPRPAPPRAASARSLIAGAQRAGDRGLALQARGLRHLARQGPRRRRRHQAHDAVRARRHPSRRRLLSSTAARHCVTTSLRAAPHCRCGTPQWTAPEIFRGVQYNEKADVYAYAMLLYGGAHDALAPRLPAPGILHRPVSCMLLYDATSPRMACLPTTRPHRTPSDAIYFARPRVAGAPSVPPSGHCCAEMLSGLMPFASHSPMEVGEWLTQPAPAPARQPTRQQARDIIYRQGTRADRQPGRVGDPLGGRAENDILLLHPKAGC